MEPIDTETPDKGTKDNQTPRDDHRASEAYRAEPHVIDVQLSL